MKINPAVFKEIGFFDERFFLYWEDVDFCLRAKKKGFNVNLEPNAKVFHDLDDIKERSWFSLFQLLKSNLIFINSYVPFWRRKVAYAYWLLLSMKIIFDKIIA